MNELLQNHVIVPWDFSDSSVAALRYAISAVDSTDRIEVVHVTPGPTAVEPGIVWGDLSEATITGNINRHFEKTLTELGLPKVKFTVLFGDPGSRIAEIAAERNAGIVVVSTHGRTGLSRLLLGSVAERIVRLSPCPVLVLRDAVSASGSGQ